MESRDFLSSEMILNKFKNIGINLNVIIETTEISLLHRQAVNNNYIGISLSDATLIDLPNKAVVRPFEDINFTWQTYFVYSNI